MRFTEETLERAVIELFESEQYIHCNGETIARPKNEVLIREDLRSFLLNRYLFRPPPVKREDDLITISFFF